MDAFAANLALNKPARQSGAWQKAVASKSGDGIGSKNMAFSGHKEHEWWSVDLGANYDVGSVTVTNVKCGSYGNYRMVIEHLMVH